MSGQSLPAYAALNVVLMPDDDSEKELARRAQIAARKAVAEGRLIRPPRCTRCPNPGPVEAHHFMGYAPEHWLDVLWLCRPCHRFSRRRPTLAKRVHTAARIRKHRKPRASLTAMIAGGQP